MINNKYINAQHNQTKGIDSYTESMSFIQPSHSKSHHDDHIHNGKY